MSCSPAADGRSQERPTVQARTSSNRSSATAWSCSSSVRRATWGSSSRSTPRPRSCGPPCRAALSRIRCIVRRACCRSSRGKSGCRRTTQTATGPARLPSARRRSANAASCRRTSVTRSCTIERSTRRSGRRTERRSYSRTGWTSTWHVTKARCFTIRRRQSVTSTRRSRRGCAANWCSSRAGGQPSPAARSFSRSIWTTNDCGSTSPGCSEEHQTRPLPPTPSPRRRGGRKTFCSPSPLRGGGWGEGLPFSPLGRVRKRGFGFRERKLSRKGEAEQPHLVRRTVLEQLVGPFRRGQRDPDVIVAFTRLDFDHDVRLPVGGILPDAKAQRRGREESPGHCQDALHVLDGRSLRGGEGEHVGGHGRKGDR